MSDDSHLRLDDLPVYFRIGSAGTGLGVGCGIGVGFGQPLNLGVVPAIGQALTGITSGLGQVSGFVGGAGHGVRDGIRRLGIKGLDAGVGCGVGIGYGFGAGLFLKPTAAEQLMRAAEGAAGFLLQHTQSRLKELGLQLPGGQHVQASFGSSLQSPPLRWDGSANPPLQGGAGTLPEIAQQLAGRGRSAGTDLTLLAPAHQGPVEAGVFTTGGGAVAVQPTAPQLEPQPEQPTRLMSGIQASEPTAEEFRAILRHEREIARLRSQNRALRAAVCKLDRRLPICKDSADDDEGGAW